MGNEMGLGAWIVSGAPAMWLGLIFLVAWFIRTWPVWKQRVTEAKAGADKIEGNQWERLREEIKRLADRVKSLEEQCAALHKEHMACLEREAIERGGRLEAEALLMAQGEIRQRAQQIVSNEREADRHGKK